MSKFNNLEVSLVMSKLSEGIAYTQVKTKKKNWQIVVVAGVPIEYRQLCMLMLAWASSCFQGNLRTKFNNETLEMWDAIKWKPDEKLDDTWDIPLYCMVALKAVSSDAASELDMLPLAQQISRELHDAITLS